jgi:hypothetical protein
MNPYPAGLLRELKNNTNLVAPVCLIVRDYVMNNSIKITDADLLKLTKCDYCSGKGISKYNVTDRLSKCLKKGYGVLTYCSLFVLLQDEKTVNKFGISLHTPSRDCKHDCKECRHIVNNSLTPVHKLDVIRYRFISNSEIAAYLCPYQLIKSGTYSDEIMKCNYDGYLSTLNDVGEVITKFSVFYHIGKTWFSTIFTCCCICNNKSDVYVIDDVRICNAKKAVPCWKYMFAKEPKWDRYL